MSARCLLDTDILSEVFKGRDASVVARATAYQAEQGVLVTTALTVMEMVKGLHRLGREDALLRMMDGVADCEVLSFDAACAETAGRIYGDLERAGQPIGRADVMIAAIAIRHERTVVTGNTRHFERIVELGYALTIDNWRSTSARAHP